MWELIGCVAIVQGQVRDSEGLGWEVTQLSDDWTRQQPDNDAARDQSQSRPSEPLPDPDPRKHS